MGQARRTCPECGSSDLKVQTTNQAGMADTAKEVLVPTLVTCRECEYAWVPEQAPSRRNP